MNTTIKNFTDLTAWQKSHTLTLLVYSITRKFPDDERFGITNQIRRAIVSVESNIAEGFGRFGQKEKKQFYSVARASLCEVQTQMLIAKDLLYCKEKEYSDFYEQSVLVSKLLTGIIKSAQSYT